MMGRQGDGQGQFFYAFAQVIETPQGERYFTLSRTVKRTPTGGRGADDGELALGLGCELKHAHRLVYAKGLDLADPAVTGIGPTCTLCERPVCPERAAPPDFRRAGLRGMVAADLPLRLRGPRLSGATRRSGGRRAGRR